MFRKVLITLGVLSIVSAVSLIAAQGKNKHHHHHNHGAHLVVVVNLKHPDIVRSDDAPGWVLVQYANELGLRLDVANSEPNKKPSLLNVEVIIPTDADVKEYRKTLVKIGFVVEVLDK